MNRKHWIFVLIGIVCCLAAYVIDPDLHSDIRLYGIPPIIFIISADAITVALLIVFDRRNPSKK